MPLGKRLRQGRRQQPGCQCVLAGAGPGSAKPLEERARTEQVEIGGIRMVQIEKSQSTDSGSGPPVLHPGQPLGMEVHRPASPPTPPSQRFVHHNQSRRHPQRYDQPERTGPVHSVHEKGQHQPRREDDQARIGNVLLEPAPTRASPSSLVVAALILGPEIIPPRVFLLRPSARSGPPRHRR